MALVETHVMWLFTLDLLVYCFVVVYFLFLLLSIQLISLPNCYKMEVTATTVGYFLCVGNNFKI